MEKQTIKGLLKHPNIVTRQLRQVTAGGQDSILNWWRRKQQARKD